MRRWVLTAVLCASPACRAQADECSNGEDSGEASVRCGRIDADLDETLTRGDVALADDGVIADLQLADGLVDEDAHRSVDSNAMSDPAVAVSCGPASPRCILTRSGQIFCWNENGITGGHVTRPTRQALPINARSVVTRNFSIIAVAVDGSVWAWGLVSNAVYFRSCPSSLGGTVVPSPQRVLEAGTAVNAFGGRARSTGLIGVGGAGERQLLLPVGDDYFCRS